MDSYRIHFRSSIRKDLRSLPKAVGPRITGRIEALGDDPFPRQAIKLSGEERRYRIRIGDYRIIYEVDTQAAQIVIHYIRHRRDIYRQL